MRYVIFVSLFCFVACGDITETPKTPPGTVVINTGGTYHIPGSSGTYQPPFQSDAGTYYPPTQYDAGGSTGGNTGTGGTCEAREVGIAGCGAGCYNSQNQIVCLWIYEDFGTHAPSWCYKDMDGDGLSSAQGDCNDTPGAGGAKIGFCYGGDRTYCSVKGIKPIAAP